MLMRGLFFTAFILFRIGCAVAQSPPGTVSSGEVKKHMNELRLVMQTRKSYYTTDDAITFSVSLHNGSDRDELLYGGTVLGNGIQMWDSLQCQLIDNRQQRIRVVLHWGVSIVSGTLDPFSVPLKAGATYTLVIAPRDYYFEFGEYSLPRYSEDLPPGSYQIGCTYTSRQPDRRAPYQLWKGAVKSELVSFEVVETKLR